MFLFIFVTIHEIIFKKSLGYTDMGQLSIIFSFEKWTKIMKRSSTTNKVIFATDIVRYTIIMIKTKKIPVPT